MICMIVKRIVSLSKQSLLSNAYKAFYNLEIMSMMVSDLFHINKHTCEYCKLDSITCIFHPSLQKFSDVMKNDDDKNLNLEIAEQKWVTWNKCKFMKLLSKQKFRLHLIIYAKFHNEKLKQKLIAKGYIFVPIETIPTIRKYTPNCQTSQILSMSNIVSFKSPNVSSDATNVNDNSASCANEPPKKRIRLL